MKLLFISSSTCRGGAEEYLLAVARGALQHGHVVHVALPPLPATEGFARELKACGIAFHPVPLAQDPLPARHRMATGAIQLFSVMTLLRSVRPAVAVIVLPFPDRCLATILAAAVAGYPAVVVFQLVPPALPGISSLHKRALVWSKRRMQRWVAISDNNRELLSRYFEVPASSIDRIYNGSRIPAVPSTESVARERSDVRRELGIPPSARILLTVGRLHPQKGYEMLVSIAPELLQQDRGNHFVWVGEGELRGMLERELESAGVRPHVAMLGYRSDVGRLMQAADLFLFPTRFEGGQSFVITEAMAQGLPIVATNASGIGEVIEHGVHGLLSPVDDRDAFLQNVQWALLNPGAMHRMSINARAQVVSFSEERMLQETMALFSSTEAARPYNAGIA